MQEHKLPMQEHKPPACECFYHKPEACVPAIETIIKKKLRVLLGRGVFRYLAGEDYSQVRFQMAKRSPFFSAAEGQLFTISMVQSPLTLKAWL